MTSTEPTGFCGCGCGERTRIAPRTNTAKGWVKGQPQRFLNNHHKSRPLAEMFWRNVDKSGDCWLWTAQISRGGYGQLSLRRRRGSTTQAHRIAYELEVGPIPEGLVIDHLCRVRHCVNPAHLEPVTSFENKARGLTSPTKTHCINGHEFTPENTYRNGNSRSCRTCSRERARAARGRVA